MKEINITGPGINAIWQGLNNLYGAGLLSDREFDEKSAAFSEWLDVNHPSPSVEAGPSIVGTWNQAKTTVAETVIVSGFRFGASSKKELIGVRAELVQLAEVALACSTQDFTVFDGLRTAAEQRVLVAQGRSKTLDSKHLTGDAIDLVPYINGKPTWDWDGCYRVACAVDTAARELGIENKIRWGGAWDRTLADFHGDASAYKRVVEEYAARQKAKGKSAFLDGPHFEWIK